jgi:hypothetical protein
VSFFRKPKRETVIRGGIVLALALLFPPLFCWWLASSQPEGGAGFAGLLIAFYAVEVLVGIPLALTVMFQTRAGERQAEARQRQAQLFNAIVELLKADHPVKVLDITPHNTSNPRIFLLVEGAPPEIITVERGVNGVVGMSANGERAEARLREVWATALERVPDLQH